MTTRQYLGNSGTDYGRSNAVIIRVPCVGSGAGSSAMKSAAPKQILLRSRLMRHHPTDAEQILWSRLRARQLGGAKFRRQHPAGPFIVDFFCHEANLAIEVDGGGHVETLQAKYDADRSAELKSREIRVLRFWNNEIFENLEGVLEVILWALGKADSEKKRSI